MFDWRCSFTKQAMIWLAWSIHTLQLVSTLGNFSPRGQTKIESTIDFCKIWGIKSVFFKFKNFLAETQHDLFDKSFRTAVSVCKRFKEADTVVRWSNLSYIRWEGWGFKSRSCQKSSSIWIIKNIFAEVRAEEKGNTFTHQSYVMVPCHLTVFV